MPSSRPSGEFRTSRCLTALSDRILDARSEIDRLLVATKGRAFVDRMLEQLPRLYESDTDQPAVESSATDATTLKVCEYPASQTKLSRRRRMGATRALPLL